MKRLIACSLFLSAIVPIACQSTGSSDASANTQAPPALNAKATNVGILIFDGLFITEFTAPFDVYKHVGDKMNVFTVGITRDSIKTYEGVVLQPDYAFKNAPRIDVLVVPSGLQSTSKDLENKELIGFVKRNAESAKYVTSHCWGAFTLAQAGCLTGRECTTFPTSIDDLQTKFPGVHTRKDERYVVSDKYITSNGGVAAFEAALHVVESLYGKETADKVAAGMVFAGQNRTYSMEPMIR
jgi:transcriptional regulator GlxA family with amidase domain